MISELKNTILNFGDTSSRAYKKSVADRFRELKLFDRSHIMKALGTAAVTIKFDVVSRGRGYGAIRWYGIFYEEWLHNGVFDRMSSEGKKFSLYVRVDLTVREQDTAAVTTTMSGLGFKCYWDNQAGNMLFVNDLGCDT